MVVHHTTRRVILVLCTIIFIIGGFVAILKMQGLVFDFEHFKFTRSGAIYVHFTPTDGTLFINGKQQTDTQGFFGKGILVSSLVPNLYRVSIASTGYYPWNKELQVDSGKVSVAARVTLWPKEIKFKKEAEHVSDFYPTAVDFVFKTASSTLYLEPYKLKGSEVVSSDMSSSYIVTKSDSSLFLIDLTNPTASTNLQVLFSSLKEKLPDSLGPTTIQHVFFHPFSKSRLLISTKTGIYSLDIKKNVLEELLTTKTPIIDATVGTSELFAVDTEGKVHVRNLILNTETTYDIDATTTKKIIPDADGSRVFLLTKDKTLYLFDRNTEKLSMLSLNVTGASFSPDGIRAVFITSTNELHMLYFKDYEGDVQKKAGTEEKYHVTQGIDATTFEWVPFAENYFFVEQGNSLRAEELDIRTPRNSISLLDDVRAHALIRGYLFVVNGKGEFLKGRLEE